MHKECPKCGSSDNVSVYLNTDSDGKEYRTEYCATPNCDYMVTDNDVVGFKSDVVQLPAYSETVILRGIKPEVLRKYSSGLSAEEGDWIFPYIDNFKLKCYKTLSKHRVNNKKVMKFVGQTSNPPLYGKQTTGTKYSQLLIVEGEIDAMSAYQMTGIPSVSIPTGASSALRAIKNNLLFIEKFRKVYICFDNDEAGNTAADTVMDFLKAGSTYRVTLTHYKDANEYLTNNAVKQFKQCISDASQKHIESLYTRDELKELVGQLTTGYNPILKGLPTGFTELDTQFSLREEEVTTIFSDPAVGKSSVVRQMVANLIHQKIGVLVIAYEESDLTYLNKICCMYYREELTTKRYKELEQDIMENIYPYITLAKLPGDTPDKVRETIEYAVRCYDTKVVCIDNITACTAGAGEIHTKIGEFYMMFTHLGKQYKHHTIVVSHTKRDPNLKSETGEVPYMRQGYGSGGIERYSYNVIALGRAHGEDIVHVAVRKNRTTGDLFEFDLSWDNNIKCFLEVERYGTERNTEERLRLNTGTEVREDVPSQHGENTEQVETGDICSDTDTELQPGLQDTVQERDSVCGG